jgi:hypothetical protein
MWLSFKITILRALALQTGYTNLVPAGKNNKKEKALFL